MRCLELCARQQWQKEAIMKVLVALFALAILGCVNAKANNDISDAILGFLDKLKADIPAEVELTDRVLELEGDIESGTINLNELSVTGLQDLDYSIDVTEGDATDGYEFLLEFSEIVVKLDLNLAVTGLLNSNDHVVATIDINNIKLQSHTEGTNDHLEMLDYNILLTIGDTIVTVEGIGNDELSKQISEALTENVSDIVDTITTAISEPISRIVKFVVNVVFKLTA